MAKLFDELGIIDYVTCAFLALAFSAANDYVETGDCNITLAFALTSVVWFLLLIIASALLRNRIEVAALSRDSKEQEYTVISLFEQLLNRRGHVFIIAGIIFICWLPVLVWLYPGTCINDTWGELQQFIGFRSGTPFFSDHHHHMPFSG